MSWVTLVQAVSTDVIARLAAAGLPPLTQGAIQMGPQYLAENRNTAPSITFVPVGSVYGPPDTRAKGKSTADAIPGSAVLAVIPSAPGSGYTAPTVTLSAPDSPGGVQATCTPTVTNGAIVSVQMVIPGSGYLDAPTVTITDADGTGAIAFARLAPDPEIQREMLIRSLRTDKKHFNVHIKGVTFTAGKPTPNPDTDYDYADLMLQVLTQSLQALMSSNFELGKGTWSSAIPGSTVVDVYGRELVVTLVIATPIPDVSLAFVPPGTMLVPTVQLQPQSGGAPQVAA